MAKKDQKKTRGLGLRRGRKANSVEEFVKAADESASVRPPKPAGKGIVWREKGWQRKMAVYLEPDLARSFERWCLESGHSHSEGAAIAFEKLLDEG